MTQSTASHGPDKPDPLGADRRESLRIVRPLQVRWRTLGEPAAMGLLHELLGTPPAWRLASELSASDAQLLTCLSELSQREPRVAEAIELLAGRVDAMSGAIACGEPWDAPEQWVELSLDGCAFPIELAATTPGLPTQATDTPQPQQRLALALRGGGLAAVLRGRVLRVDKGRCAVAFDEDQTVGRRAIGRYVMKESL